MKIYKVVLYDKIFIERKVEANSEDEAEKNALENNSKVINETEISEPVWEVDKVVEMCPHCEVELKSKMFDIDGTNLEEHTVCPDCGYGSPALR